MKMSQLLLLALGGVVVYLIYTKTKAPAPAPTSVTNNSTGGAQSVTGDNTFNNILGAVSSVIGIYQSAQTAPKTL